MIDVSGTRYFAAFRVEHDLIGPAIDVCFFFSEDPCAYLLANRLQHLG